MAELVRRRFPDVEVRTCPDGQAALTDIATHRPSVIISDFRMPGMNGLEFLTRVHEEHGSIPAMLLTAFDERGSAQDAARRGIVRRFFLKPPDIDQILEGLEELLDPASMSV